MRAVPSHFLNFELCGPGAGHRLVNVAAIIDISPAPSGGCIVCLSVSPEDSGIHVTVEYDKLIEALSYFSLVESF